MANEKNLIPFSKRSESEARENGKKGGRASGKARREKADLRKMAQTILDGTYTARSGEELTGAELVWQGIMDNISDPYGKNWGKAMRRKR